MRKLFCCLFVCCLALKSLLAADTIITDKEQKIENITVLQETYSHVYYYFDADRARSRQSFKQYQVKEVVYDQVPTLYQNAQTLFAAGKYQTALSEFQKAARNSGWSQQYALFFIAECWRKLDQFPKALVGYNRLRKKFPKTKFLPESHFYSGKCLYQIKRWRPASEAFQKAESLYQKIEKQQQAQKATYWKANVYEKAGKFSYALRSYQEVASDKKDASNIARKAHVRLGFCFVGMKKLARAKKHFLDLITDEETTSQELMGLAYLGLGNSHYHSNNLKKALFSYLRVIVLYQEHVAEEIVAQAYHRAATCFERLNTEENDYRARAKRLRQEAHQKYPQWKF